MQDAVQTEQNRASPVIRQPQALLQSPATPPSRNMSLTSDLLTRPLSASRNGLGCLTCGRPVYAAEGITVDGQPLHKSCLRCVKCGRSLLLTSTIVRPTGVYCQQHAPAEASMYKYIRPLTLNGDLKAGNLSMFEEKLTRRLEETDCVRPDPSDSRLLRKRLSDPDLSESARRAFASVLENTNGRSGHDVGSCLQPTSAADAGVRATAGKGFADKQAQQPKQPQQQPLLRPAPPPLVRIERHTSHTPTLGMRQTPAGPGKSGEGGPDHVRRHQRTATAPEDGHAGRSRDDAEVTDEERPGDFLNLCLGLFDGSTESRKSGENSQVTSTMAWMARKLSFRSSDDDTSSQSSRSRAEKGPEASTRKSGADGAPPLSHLAGTGSSPACDLAKIIQAPKGEGRGKVKPLNLSTETGGIDDLSPGPASGATAEELSADVLEPRLRDALDRVTALRHLARSATADIDLAKHAKEAMCELGRLAPLLKSPPVGSRDQLAQIQSHMSNIMYLTEQNRELEKLVTNSASESAKTSIVRILKGVALRSTIILFEHIPQSISCHGLVFPVKGYQIEHSGLSKRKRPHFEHVDSNAKWYRKYFLGREHKNYMGLNDAEGPVLVSVVREESSMVSPTDSTQPRVFYLVIVRRRDAPDIRAVVSGADLPVKSKGGEPSKGHWLAAMNAAAGQALAPYGGPAKLKRIKDRGIVNDILSFDEHQLSNRFKVGIMYCAAGQLAEDDWFGNRTGSAEFDAFLSVVGQKIRLRGWTGYAAGLDTKSGNTGEFTVVNDSTLAGYEVTYHVSTLLPYIEGDSQQIQRKRHIGNDIVSLVFVDGDQPFDPSAIRSQFLHVFIVVRRERTDNGPGYRVAVVSNEHVPPFGPSLPNPPVFMNAAELKFFLLAKAINGESAAYKAPKLATPHARARLSLLDALAEKAASLGSRSVSRRGSTRKDKDISSPKLLAASGSHHFDPDLPKKDSLVDFLSLQGGEKGRLRAAEDHPEGGFPASGKIKLTDAKRSYKSDADLVSTNSEETGGESPSPEGPEKGEDLKGLKSHAKSIFDALHHFKGNRRLSAPHFRHDELKNICQITPNLHQAPSSSPRLGPEADG